MALPEGLPPSSPDDTAVPDNDLRAAAKGALISTRLATFCQVALAAVFLLALGQPDRLLFEQQLGIRLPFAGTEVDLFLFFVAGPIVLFLSWIHLQRIRGKLRQYRAIGQLTGRSRRASILSNQWSGTLPELLHFVVFPGTLFVFAFKASFRPDAGIWFGAAGAATIAMFLVLARDRWRRWPWPHRGLFVIRYGAIVSAASLLALAPNEATRLAPLNLSQAELAGRDLVGLRLVRARINGANLAGARMVGVDLRSANLIGANLSDANLRDAKLDDSDLTAARLKSADLSRASLARSKLVGADLSHARLPQSRLFGADFTGARLVETDLSNADLAGANLGKVEMVRSNLTEANLRFAQFHDAAIQDSILVGAQLIDANLTGTDLSGSILRDANLAGATLMEVGITATQLQQACVSGEPANIDNVPERLRAC